MSAVHDEGSFSRFAVLYKVLSATLGQEVYRTHPAAPASATLCAGQEPPALQSFLNVPNGWGAVDPVTRLPPLLLRDRRLRLVLLGAGEPSAGLCPRPSQNREAPSLEFHVKVNLGENKCVIV